MNKRRLTISLILLGGGLLGFLLLANLQQKEQPADPTGGQAEATVGDEQAGEPSSRSSEASTTRPATGEAPREAPPDRSEPEGDLSSPALPERDVATSSTQAAQPVSTASAGLQGNVWFDNARRAATMYRAGSRDPRTGYTGQLELTSRGAAVNTLKLAKYFATVEDKQLWEDSPDQYEAKREANPEKYEGHYSLLNPVAHGDTRYLAYETYRLVVQMEGAEEEVLNVDRKNWRRVETPGSAPADAQSISFALKFYYGPTLESARPVLRLVKTYTIRKDDYSFDLALSVENLSNRSMSVSIEQSGPTGVPREDFRSDMRQGAVGRWSSEDQAVGVELHDRGELDKVALGADVLSMGDDDAERGPVVWMGVVNKYFGSMMYLRPAEGEGPAAPTWSAQYDIMPAKETPSSRTFSTQVRVPDILLKAGQSRQMGFDVFAGPKKREMFSNPKATYYKAQYEELNYLSTISFGWCACSQLSLAMMWLLQHLSIVTLGNYGLAIILLVILVRTVLHPLTKKGQISMQKMQKLAPQMQRLKEKYADDKEALNREMMNLYKQAGASPFLGCLPMFLQMPIWIALYTGLNASVELRHAGLLPFWLTDLAAPDAIFTWSAAHSLWIVGNRFSLLPILMAIAMALQSKFNPQMAAQASMSPDQAKQQKFMKYFFPGFFLLIFYRMPSGLNLYIMTSTFAGVAEQYVIRKHLREKEAAEAAAETTVKMPGKAPRSKRPKKPKGPFWTKQG